MDWSTIHLPSIAGYNPMFASYTPCVSLVTHPISHSIPTIGKKLVAKYPARVFCSPTFPLSDLRHFLWSFFLVNMSEPKKIQWLEPHIFEPHFSDLDISGDFPRWVLRTPRPTSPVLWTADERHPRYAAPRCSAGCFSPWPFRSCQPVANASWTLRAKYGWGGDQVSSTKWLNECMCICIYIYIILDYIKLYHIILILYHIILHHIIYIYYIYI